jgi:magnesium transporter
MLTSHPPSAHGKTALTADAVSWVDLLQPTDDEIKAVESRFGLQLPSRAELSEVELSSRVSEEGGVLFLNMPTVTTMSETTHVPSPVGFVLSKDVLITLRYTELRSFDMAVKKFAKDGKYPSAIDTFATIVDDIVDLSADLLEGVATELESVSRSIFARSGKAGRNEPQTNAEHREVLIRVGNAGERLSHIRDSILSLQRIVIFVAGSELTWIPHETKVRLATPKTDLSSLNEYQTYLADKVQFLLDAVLGFINIKQNDIFQMLTVISVVGIPPTLVASIYGMNFRNMPELSWAWGYQWGLAMILLSAIVPIVWFKWRKWV